MRKLMTKQVTKTTIKSAQMKLVDGSPTAIELPDEVVLGNLNHARSQKHIDSIHDNATVLDVNVERVVYEMEVEEFIKYATIKKD